MAQLNTKILLLNGTQGDWAKLQGYVLSKGEPAVEFIPAVPTEENPDVKVTAIKLKIGDGFTQFKDLPYVGDHVIADLEERFDSIESAMNSMGNAVFQINAGDLKDLAGTTEGEKVGIYVNTLIAQTEGSSVNEGNIAIVKKTIHEKFTNKEGVEIPAHYSYTAYVYNGTVWTAMDGNYNAENVYFNDDITFTANIGALTLASGKTKGTFESKGKSLEEVLKGIMAKTLAPTINQPKFTLDSVSVKSYTTNTVKTSATETKNDATEIGNYITALEWKGTFTDGTYSYGYQGGTGTANKNAGCTATYEVSCDKTGTASGQTKDGTWTLTNNIQIDSTDAKTYATITNKCTWNDSPRTPINNIGDSVSGAIESASASGSKGASITGHRSSFYYVGTDNTTTIDNAFIRNSFSRRAKDTTFKVDTKTPGGAAFSGVIIPANTTRVMFAVPGKYNNIAVINVDGMGLPEDGFEKTTVRVKGANDFVSKAAQKIANTDTDALENEDGYLYTVFTKENANGMAATGFTVTIS